MAGEKQGWEGAFKMGCHGLTPPKLQHLAKEKCHTIADSTFVSSDPNWVLGEHGRAWGVPQHLQPGCAKGVTCFTTDVAQHSFSLVVPFRWATLGQHPRSLPS